MKLTIISLIILIFCFSRGFCFISKFLDLDTNSVEYQLLIHPEKFDLKTASLIAAGIKPEYLSSYLAQISNFEIDIRAEINTDNQLEAARTIFSEMHKKILTRYDESSTTLDVLLRTGKFNCLSSTAMYSSLLEDFNIPYKAVVLPTHIYSMLLIGGRDVDVENTSPYGFDIGTNREAQENFKKLTGFSYSHESSQIEVVDKKGIIAYTYGNTAYFASRLGQVQSSFQNALKSMAVFMGGIYINTNAVAAYSQYTLYLTDVKKDYQKAIDISAEAISNLPMKEMFTGNYYYTLDKYLNLLVESNRFSEAFSVYENSLKTVPPNEGIEDNLYARILYKMINKDQDFTNAFITGKRFLKNKPGSLNLKNLMINGLELLSKKLVAEWRNYPAGEDFFKQWYGLIKDVNFDIILENYYSDIGIKFYEAGDSDKGIEIIKNGLKILPKSVVLVNNIAYVAGSTANKYFKAEDLQSGIYYLKIALENDSNNPTLTENLKSAYRMWAGNEIDRENFRKALDIVKEGLKIFPSDGKLLYYKDYINRKATRNK